MGNTKIAIKRLTASDLSFFKTHLRLSKQKAINLNSDIFIDRFYPGLRGITDPVPMPLAVIGPAGNEPHRLMRKALRPPGAKNWRLNGEVIHDPPEAPGRYDNLAENDYAIIAFQGNERPTAATLVLVSARGDHALHQAIENTLEFPGRYTMQALPETSLARMRAVTTTAYVTDEHPLDSLLLSQDTIEDVLFGDTAPEQTASDGRSVALTAQELREQLRRAEETGQQGEELFGAWLSESEHRDEEFDWVSSTHARAAFDFDVLAARWIEGNPRVFVDVKTTQNAFERPLHMSIAELRFASRTPNYRIARIYDLAGTNPKLKILASVDLYAKKVLESLASLPAGVVVDSIQLKPEVFTTEHSVIISRLI